MSETRQKTPFALVFLGILFVVIFASASIGGGEQASQIVQGGTGQNTFSTGSAISNLISVNFPTPYTSKPILICCPFTTTFIGLQTISNFWSTVYVPPQIRNATAPSFDASARHDQNNSTCSPCTNKVSITPSTIDEILIVHIFYISDVTITVSSVTGGGLTFHPIQPFGAGSFSEAWYTTTYSTSSIQITVTFSAPSSTIVTTSVVATTFSNAVAIVNTHSGSSFTSPVSVVNPLANQYSLIVGDWYGTDPGTACHYPTPGSSQTQILNGNSFCSTNTNGGVDHLYDYDVEYFRTDFQTSYTYNTNFNGTFPGSPGQSITFELAGNQFHDKTWNIVSSTNSTLYNSDQYDTPLNPSATVNSPLGPPQSITGTIYMVCNFASANVTINFDYEIQPGPWMLIDHWSFFSGNLCDGQQHTVPTAPDLSGNFLSRIRAFSSASVSISLSSMVIGWRVVGQIQIRESITSITVTGFQVRWLASYPAPQSYNVNFVWNATGT